MGNQGRTFFAGFPKYDMTRSPYVPLVTSCCNWKVVVKAQGEKGKCGKCGAEAPAYLTPSGVKVRM